MAVGRKLNINGKPVFFFDRALVMAAAQRGQIGAMNKAGGFVRQTARRSIKEAPNSNTHARAGMPPLAHSSSSFTRLRTVKKKKVMKASSPLKELIFYAYEPTSGKLIVGPMLFWHRAKKNWRAPEVLEKGGRATERTSRGVTVYRWRGNPFMVPALRANLNQFAGAFRNSIHE